MNFKVGDRVHSNAFGYGVVRKIVPANRTYNREQLEIRFDGEFNDYGYFETNGQWTPEADADFDLRHVSKLERALS